MPAGPTAHVKKGFRGIGNPGSQFQDKIHLGSIVFVSIIEVVEMGIFEKGHMSDISG